jgi:thymidylate kinase
MSNQQSWEALDALKKDLPNIEIVPIVLMCSSETHKERINRRGTEDKEHLNLGGDKLEDVLYKYEFIKSLDRDNIIRVDANGSIEEVYKKVLYVLKLI